MILLDDIEEKIWYGRGPTDVSYDEIDRIREINKGVKVMRLLYKIDEDLIEGRVRCLKDYLSGTVNPTKKA